MDHNVISTEIKAPRVDRNKPRKLIRCYNKADFSAINNELMLFLNSFLISFSSRSVEENWTAFKAKVTELSDTFIPLVRVRSGPVSAWYNTTLRRLSNKRKRLFRAAKKTSDSSRWEKYHQALKVYKSTVKRTKSSFMHNTLPSLVKRDPRKFWNIVNPRQHNRVTLKSSDGAFVPVNECATVLNDSFVKNFTSANTRVISHLPSANHYPMDQIIIDTFGIAKVIDNIKLSSSCGIDGINSKFLKSTKMYSSMVLSKIFEQSLYCGVLPKDWKCGKVIPMFKKGDRSSPLNYRPISLTSVCCKILEHIIYSNLVKFLEENSFFTKAQHGFRSKFSCETQLVSFVHDLGTAIDQRCCTDVVFLDFSKAFDLVPHNLLFYKLSLLNIDTFVLQWISSFLSGRQQYVEVNDFSSPVSPVTSGVPQGSVLGPILFLIYINDLPTCISSRIRLFADDCVVYRQIRSVNDPLLLQSDLDALSDWCKTWSMSLSIEKCKFMRFSTQPSVLPEYQISGLNLEHVSVYKYLGIYFANNLSWKTHVYHILNNANRALGYLKRHFSRASPDVKKTLYVTLVRSKLEYAASVWDPQQAYLAQEIESLQSRAVRFIFNDFSRLSSVTSMRNSLALPTLAVRRKAARLYLFHKIFYQNTVLRDEMRITESSYTSARLDHSVKVAVPRSRTGLHAESFLPKTSREWNSLPDNIAIVRNHDIFRNLLNIHLQC